MGGHWFVKWRSRSQLRSWSRILPSHIVPRSSLFASRPSLFLQLLPYIDKKTGPDGVTGEVRISEIITVLDSARGALGPIIIENRTQEDKVTTWSRL